MVHAVVVVAVTFGCCGGTALARPVHGTIAQAEALCLAQGGAFDNDAVTAYLCVSSSGSAFEKAQLGRARAYCVGPLSGVFGALASATTDSGVTGPAYYCDTGLPL